MKFKHPSMTRWDGTAHLSLNFKPHTSGFTPLKPTSKFPSNPRAQHTYHTPTATMKLLTLNFLTCAIKSCKTQPSSFPLHPRDAELEIQEADINLPFLKNILPRLMWEEIRVIAREVRWTTPRTFPREGGLKIYGWLLIRIYSWVYQSYLRRRQRPPI